MTRRIFYGLLSAILLSTGVSAQANSSRICLASADDDRIVAETVHAFYKAERTGDSSGWLALTTADFYMFHEGVVTPPNAFANWIDHEHMVLQKDKAFS